MECRPLEIIIESADGLKDVNIFSKMDVYAAVSVSGDPRNKKQKTRTSVVKDGGTNPKFNSYAVKFTVDDAALQQNRLSLSIKLVSDRTLGDTKIGKVKIPIRELFDAVGGGGGGDDQKKAVRHVSYGVRSASGKPKGTIHFGYKFGDKFTVQAPEAHKKAQAHEPVMAYPTGHPGSSSGYPPQAQHGYAYPPQPQAGYGYAPQPQAGYGYAPQQQPGYGYPPQPGYGYPPQKPKRGGGNMAMGVGAGLLGGLLIGDMIGDVGEMGAYDAGYDAGFGGDDFGGGFDF